MKLNTLITLMVIASGPLWSQEASKAAPQPSLKPLPEVYVLKIQMQEKERQDRESKLGEIRKLVMADLDKAEQGIIVQACRDILSVDIADCQVTQESQTSPRLMIGYRPGYVPPAPAKGEASKPKASQ